MKDGLQNYEFNTEAALKLKDGRLLFGGVDGYNVIDPAKINNVKSLPPTVVISSIKIFDREVPQGDGSLKLKYTENNLTFEFAALSFYRNQDNRYAYKMEGIDPDWIYSNDRRFVTYSNIKPGDYIFKVKASNSDDVWNETGTQLAITISPPWWQTWWMYVLYFVTAVSFIIGFIKWRERNVKKEKVILENKITVATKQIRIEKERAEQSEKFKQQFLANMSHEIRTPMNAVMGMTNLVLDSELNPKQKKYLTGVKNASENLLHIINEILDLSKVEAGKMELEEIDFSIRDVVEQVYQVLKHKADEKSIELIISINSNVPEVVVGDPVRLYQILLNLTGNAIKFTDKGSVQLAVDCLPLATASVETSNLKLQTLNFCVIDTGIGIPQDKLQTIFDSFSQANSSDSRKYGGTGLGLSISKQFIKLMGGKLIVESVVNSGSTFSFALHLPIGSSENLLQQKSSEEIDGNILDGLKILLVDDNSGNRIVCRDTLESKSKVIIEEAANGQEAVALLSEKDFDIVLMDVQMPVMDGYEATRVIRDLQSMARNHTIPILALTASVIRSDLDKCRAAGMNDYVPKTFQDFRTYCSNCKSSRTGNKIYIKK
ncbi:MAG: response regulator [Bacteroidetes bacterium]|nr:response regulator [Bacteroidota bacterium]